MGLLDFFRRREDRADDVSEMDKLLRKLRSSLMPERPAIVRQFHITEDEFHNLYASYYLSLVESDTTERWNDDIDDLAREIGALSEDEIAAAHTDLHEAVLNRIKLRLVMDRTQQAGATSQSGRNGRETEKELVHTANWSAISAYATMAKMFPEIADLKNIQNWDFFVTAGIVASAVFHLQMALDRDLIESVQNDIGEELTEIYPQGWDAVFDCVQFVDRAKKPDVREGVLSDREVEEFMTRIHEQIGASIGSWVIWNLKDCPPGQRDWPLVSAIGRFCYEGIGNQAVTAVIEKYA